MSSGIDGEPLNRFFENPKSYYCRVKSGDVSIQKHTIASRIKSILPWKKNEYRADKVLDTIYKQHLTDKIDFRIIKILASQLKTPPEWFQKMERDEVIKGIQEQKGMNLNPKFNQDSQFILEALKLDRSALDYASPLLKKDPDFMLKAYAINDRALFHASRDLTNDPEFMLKAMGQNKEAFFYADPQLKKNQNFLLEAIKINPWILTEVTPDVLEDRAFVENALTIIPEDIKKDFRFSRIVNPSA